VRQELGALTKSGKTLEVRSFYSILIITQAHGCMGFKATASKEYDLFEGLIRGDTRDHYEQVW
jgi:hypothetical protein